MFLSICGEQLSKLTDKEKVLSGDSDSSRVADISIFIHFSSIELESIPACTGQRHVGTESS